MRQVQNKKHFCARRYFYYGSICIQRVYGRMEDLFCAARLHNMGIPAAAASESDHGLMRELEGMYHRQEEWNEMRTQVVRQQEKIQAAREARKQRKQSTATCVVPNCPKRVHAKLLCHSHYESMRERPKCSVDGCQSTGWRKKMCRPHYSRMMGHAYTHKERQRRSVLKKRVLQQQQHCDKNEENYNDNNKTSGDITTAAAAVTEPT